MPDPTAPDGITLDHATVEVAGKRILSEITLTLTEPRIGIVGRNGSGKTTLLRVIAGLIAPSSGHVRIGMLDPAGDRKAVLAEIGILFQNPDHMILFPTVQEELAFGLAQTGLSETQARHAALAALEAEGRGHWAKAATHTLSQGQRHYLCLLSVLLMQPRRLLLDEPFAGMDLPTITRVTRRLASLDQQVIVISHDPAAVASADRVIWLDRGRVVADGPTGQVLDDFVTTMARIGEGDADTDLAG